MDSEDNGRLHARGEYRRTHGDTFYERLMWHGISSVATAAFIMLLQWALATNGATAANLSTRVNSLEIQAARTDVTLVGIHEELQRLNANIEHLRK